MFTNFGQMKNAWYTSSIISWLPFKKQNAMYDNVVNVVKHQ